MARPRGRPPKRNPSAGNSAIAPIATDGGIDAKDSDDANTETASGTDAGTETGPRTAIPGEYTGGSAETVGSEFAAGNTGTINTDPAKRGRGRPPGSGKKAPIDISGVEKLLLGIHQGLMLIGAPPEFALSSAEAHEISKAYAEVAKYYPALTLDNRYTAISTLGAQLSIIYGSRFMSYKMRTASEKRTPQQRANQSAPPQSPISETPGVAPPAKTEPVSRELRTGEIPGVGNIEFPADHPLMGGRRPN